ncbi:hypothetical protein [Cellulomonas aerilata]|uniref:Uncharacterized protein n=1 Tax=Cellulomonas aerilata TaxID=515326 RepID=A0A512DAX5_9CELL|nr:hypothetical protein [Cellulomonas aerilata]GEO33636.1 hypothetical protein CAE01nite_13610 [Cellulomonas aerilata]
MDLDAWWPLLAQASRDWLVAHAGEALTEAVLDDIARVAGSVPSDAWWGVERGPDGLHLSDAGVDWIEAVANGESPQAPPDR